MYKELPLFPLSFVTYPQRFLNLHIFEPRYKQLIKDCIAQKATFGIPVFMNDKVRKYGTEMEIVEVAKVYPDGTMDIKTKGINLFKIQNLYETYLDRLYIGAELEIVEIGVTPDEEMENLLIEKLKIWYQILQMQSDIDLHNLSPCLSYSVAHRIGLSLEQQYSILCLSQEEDRQQYILDHLEKAIPMLQEIEESKQMIRMNGHFKNFDPLDF